MTDEPTTKTLSNGWREIVADAHQVEIHWCEAQDHLDAAPTNSAEAARLRTEIRQLQDEYARLIREVRRNGRPLPSSPIPADGRPARLRAN